LNEELGEPIGFHGGPIIYLACKNLSDRF